LRFATTQLATGPRLHYAEAGVAGGDPLVFLHGWPDSWFSFSRVLPLLPQHYRVLVPDQRGFGESERPDSGYRIPDLAADAVAFLDAMSIERATVVGHSLGSFIARRIAIAYPDRVGRLVLIGSGLTSMNPVTRDVQASLLDLTDPLPVAFVREFQASTAYVPLPESFFEQVVAESLKAPARIWRDVFAGLLAYRDAEQLSRIAAPTYLMWGDKDALFSKDDQDGVRAAIPGAVLQIYRETGHCPNWERPEQVAADLTGFIEDT
jgi:non-heme chloroperoxidase